MLSDLLIMTNPPATLRAILLLDGLARQPGSVARDALCLFALACGVVLLPMPQRAAAQSAPVIEIAKFSAAREGRSFPDGWEPWILSKGKKLTEYTLVTDGPTVVVKAVAHASASGLIRRIRIDPKEYPVIQWRWKAANLIRAADNGTRSKEDSPVRIYIGFEGDIATLPLHDRLFFKIIKLASGQDMPFATLNYIWENDAPAGTIIPNPSTDRIQAIVTESGPGKVGQWITYERNLYEDYKRAFGQEPPAIKGVFLMTDTDNTGETATGYYGDILLKKAGQH